MINCAILAIFTIVTLAIFPKAPFMSIFMAGILPFCIISLCVWGCVYLAKKAKSQDKNISEEMSKKESLFAGLRCLGAAIMIIVAIALVAWLLFIGTCAFLMGDFHIK